jgi:hypothetical protein
MKLRTSDLVRLREFGGFMLHLALPMTSLIAGILLLFACLDHLGQWQTWDLGCFLRILWLGAVLVGLGARDTGYWCDRISGWWKASGSAPGPTWW